MKVKYVFSRGIYEDFDLALSALKDGLLSNNPNISISEVLHDLQQVVLHCEDEDTLRDLDELVSRYDLEWSES